MDVVSGGLGVFDTPYLIDMWQRLDIPVTMTTYGSPFPTPHSYVRCDIKTTLHYNDVHTTPVDTAKWVVDSASAPTQLSIQWDYAYTFDDFFILRIQVIYHDGVKDIVVVNDE